MTTDQFIEFFSRLCNQLLPILGCVLIIFLISLLRKIIKFFITLNTTLLTINTTVETTNEQIRKLDAPLNTVSELSETVDNLHKMSQNATKSALIAVLSNLNAIKDWILGQLEKDERFQPKKTQEENIVPNEDKTKDAYPESIAE